MAAARDIRFFSKKSKQLIRLVNVLKSGDIIIGPCWLCKCWDEIEAVNDDIGLSYVEGEGGKVGREDVLHL